MAQPKKSGSKSGKSSAGTGKGKKTAAPAVNTGSSNRAFYILVIIILVTVIVLLVNRYADKGMFKFPEFKTDKSTVEKKKDKKEEDAGDSKTAAVQKEVKQAEPVKDNSETNAVQEKNITIYLLKLDEKSEKIYLSQVKRKVKGESILESAIQSLIKGPTSAEQNRGFITAVPASLRLRSVNIKGTTAEIDFSGEIEESASGDIVIKRVQQIVYTATQFKNIDSIVILINGQKRKTLGSDGFSISGPLRR